MKKELNDEINNAISLIYKDFFAECEDIMLAEFGIKLDYLKVKSQTKPLPYLRAIYTHYCLNKGVPIKVIANRLDMNNATPLAYWRNKYDDSYKYNEDFKVLADRFNKRLKEKENGIQETNV